MDMPEYKALVRKYFLWTAGICLGGAALFAGIFHTLDPLQFYHRASGADGPLSSNMRAQAAGILNTFDIDSIILGTSMLENTSAAEASAKLGGKFFNISLSGGDYAERALLLRRALQKDRKNVIYSLDRYYLTCPGRDYRIPGYLYDDNPFNDIRYYATPASLKRLFSPAMGLTQKDHDRPNAWLTDAAFMARFGGIGKWVAHRDHWQIRDFLFRELPAAARASASASREETHDEKREQAARRYVDQHLLELIQGRENTNFYLIFPPYSRLFYAVMRRTAPQDFFLHQAVVRHLVERTRDHKNIHVFGFEDQDFPDDIANYKDTTHYHPRFNSLFLDAMAAGRHELTPENVEDYLRRCEQKAWDYDIPALHDEVQRLLGAGEKKAGA